MSLIGYLDLRILAKLTSSLAPKPTECEDRPAFTIFIDPITSDGKDSKFRAAGKLQGDSIANKPQRHFKLFNLTASKKIAKENRVSDSAIRDESSSAVTKGESLTRVWLCRRIRPAVTRARVDGLCPTSDTLEDEII